RTLVTGLPTVRSSSAGLVPTRCNSCGVRSSFNSSSLPERLRITPPFAPAMFGLGKSPHRPTRFPLSTPGSIVVNGSRKKGCAHRLLAHLLSEPLAFAHIQARSAACSVTIARGRCRQDHVRVILRVAPMLVCARSEDAPRHAAGRPRGGCP